MLEFDLFYIEKINVKDAWNLCDFIVANEDRLKDFFPKTLAQNLTPDLSKRFVEIKFKEFDLKEEFLFTIKEKESHALMGLVYLKELDWESKQGEFAYCIGYQFEGKGFISKTVKALSQYAFNHLELKTLQIIVHKSNIGSVKVAENCNFIWQKTLPKEFTPPNKEPLDMELYELYNDTNM
jgi:ribosomal-protein-alanine N-acetyltransferase